MATHGRGLVCAPLTQDRCKKLGLDLMVGHNTAIYEKNMMILTPQKSFLPIHDGMNKEIVYS